MLFWFLRCPFHLSELTLEKKNQNKKKLSQAKQLYQYDGNVALNIFNIVKNNNYDVTVPDATKIKDD